jgi:hypothetical protein
MRGWLIAFGVIEILMGCAFVLMIVLSAFAFLGPAAAKLPPNAMSTGPMSRTALLGLVGIQYGLIAAVFFTGGIGSIRCKNWARIWMLVVSSLWLGIGLLSTLFMAFMMPAIMRQQPGKVSPGMQNSIVVGMIIFMTVLMVLLPAIFLFFYSRKSVKATCLAQAATPAAGCEADKTGLPVPLAILGGWEALSAFSVFVALFMPMTIVFGFVVHGITAFLVFLAHSILSGYAAWFIFRQKLIGWKISLFKTGFWTISMLVTYARYPDLLQLYRGIGLNAQTVRIYEQVPQLLTVVWVGLLAMMTVLLVFILYARKFFPTAGED